MVTYSVDALQEGIAQNIEGHATSGLDTSVNHAITGIRKGKVFLLHSKLVVSDSKRDNRELVRSGAAREKITLLS